MWHYQNCSHLLLLWFTFTTSRHHCIHLKTSLHTSQDSTAYMYVSSAKILETRNDCSHSNLSQKQVNVKFKNQQLDRSTANTLLPSLSKTSDSAKNFSNQWEHDIYLSKVLNSEKCFTETSRSLYLVRYLAISASTIRALLANTGLPCLSRSRTHKPTPTDRNSLAFLEVEHRNSHPQTDRQTDRQTHHRQTDRETDTHTHAYTYSVIQHMHSLWTLFSCFEQPNEITLTAGMYDRLLTHALSLAAFFVFWAAKLNNTNSWNVWPIAILFPHYILI